MERRTTVALIVGVIMTVVLISECKSVENCDFCERQYRKSNTDCSSTGSGCGACLEGFEEHADTFCHYVWNASHNSNATIIAGDSVILTCLFKDLVSCLWIKETIVETDERISYMNGTGRNTRDCSIEIRKFKSSDVGKWSCSSMGTSSALGMLKSNVWLNIVNSTKEPVSLLPKIDVKQVIAYESPKSKRSIDLKVKPSLWFECSIKSILPVKLYWTKNGDYINTTSNTKSQHETRIFLELPKQTEKEMETLICFAEYPNINQKFSDAVNVTLSDSTITGPGPHNEQMPMTLWIVLIIGIAVVLVVFSIATCVLCIKFRIKTKKMDAEVCISTSDDSKAPLNHNST